MKKVAVAAIFLLLFSTFAQAAESWEKLTVEAGNFTVSVPGKPKKHTQTVETEVGRVEATIYLVELNEGRLVYLVAYSDYPKDSDKNSEPEAVLDGVRDGNLKPHAGKLTDETKIKIDGFPGREFTYTGKLGGEGEPIVGHNRLYLVGTRLYQMIVLAPVGTPPEKEDIGRFFFSFDRTKK